MAEMSARMRRSAIDSRRPSHGLSSIPSDAGTVLMQADNRRVDHLHGGVIGASQGVHNLAPDARPPPANEAIVAGGVWTEGLRQVAPRRPGPQPPKDAVEDTPVIHTRDTAWLVRQHRLDDNPFVVGKFVAHYSKFPRFGA